MMFATMIGLSAGVLQASAYFLYTRLVLKCETRPNGMSWLMWAYGTFVFFFIEFDVAAPLSVLILPAVCMVCALIVSVYSFVKSSYIPPERGDYAALFVDLLLMGSYLVLLLLLSTGVITGEQQASLAMIFLVLTSLSTLVTFYPIMRTTFEDPCGENPIPWFIWTVAYGLLLYTVMIEGMSWQYMIYPILNILLHGSIGVFALTDDPRTLPWKTNTTISP